MKKISSPFLFYPKCNVNPRQNLISRESLTITKKSKQIYLIIPCSGNCSLLLRIHVLQCASEYGPYEDTSDQYRATITTERCVKTKCMNTVSFCLQFYT